VGKREQLYLYSFEPEAPAYEPTYNDIAELGKREEASRQVSRRQDLWRYAGIGKRDPIIGELAEENLW
jgi:hypothetical protein